VRTDHRDVEQLLDMVRRFGGIDFPPGRRAGIERPIQAAMDRLQVTSVGALVGALGDARNEDELERLVASLTIGETHFFRNHPQVDAIQRVILPNLIDLRRRERRLRIWSAGCSSGEEAYSVAIALDMLLADRDRWTIEIVGTDINDVAIAKAREGLYGEWSFRGVPQSIRRRYFAQEGRRFRLDPEIRQMVTFRELNLVSDTYPSRQSNTAEMDLILCRNVLIYFRPETIDAVVTRLERAVAPGGWMMAGHAESPMPIFRELFDVQELPMAVLYRKRAPQPAGREAVQAPATVAAEVAAATPWLPVEREPDEPLDEMLVVGTPRPAPTVARSAFAGEQLDDEPVVTRALALFARGDRDGALALLQADAESTPDDASALIVAARLLAGAVQYEAAEHVIRMAIARDRTCAVAHYVHALTLQGLGRADEALEALRRSAYLDPASPLVAYSLASQLDTVGQTGRARSTLDRAVKLLDAMDDDHVIDEHEGLTAGHLRKLAAIRRQLLPDEVGA
jgi:chemotaxis protein methyltransferase CheR